MENLRKTQVNYVDSKCNEISLEEQKKCKKNLGKSIKLCQFQVQ